MAIRSSTTTSSEGRSFWDHATLQGKSCGAELLVRRNGTSDSQDCCINIYISNNTQGANNSTLVGSKVKMGDPGVTLSFGDLNVDRGILMRHKKKTRTRRRSNFSWGLSVGSFASVLVLILMVLFFLSLP